MFLTAYYFRAHMYTLVPSQVREDLRWMAGVGTDAVAIAVLEQDLFAARENIDLIAAEADRVGIRLWAVPSRWGGLVAGSPKVPSLWASTRPEVWATQADGGPIISFGPRCSVHHEASFEFFARTLEEMVTRFPFEGFVWDEPKHLGAIDHSEAARRAAAAAGADPLSRDWHTGSTLAFFDRVTAHAKSVRPELRAAMFLYGHLADTPDLLDRCAALLHVDDFGMDGRPWSLAKDQPSDAADERSKSILDQFPAFQAAAARHGKRSLFLIENHNMGAADFALMDRRLPDVLGLGADHVLYYYYPRNVSDPDRQMAILAKHLKHARQTALPQ